MDTSGRARWHRRLHIVCAAAALLAAGCTTPNLQYLPADPSYARERHPVSVENSVATLVLSGAAGAERLAPSEIARLDGFVAGYISGGHGRLMVTVPGADAGQKRALARGKRIVDRALGRGVRDSEVRLEVEATESSAGAPIVVSYERFVVRVPECGDWSKESSHDITNTIYSDFGCATQRSLALIVANPADLIAPRRGLYRDTVRSNLVIQLYRAGEVTLAERAAVEEAALEVAE